jgi:hypothetical protein
MLPTRFYDRRTIKTPTEQFAAEMCKQAGVKYAGILPAFFDEKKGKSTPAYILADNSYGSTYCVALEGCTVERLVEEFLRSNSAWEQTVTAAAEGRRAEEMRAEQDAAAIRDEQRSEAA